MRMRVVQPGVLACVQDLGRPGLASMGVPGSGAADTMALRVGNRLVGNPDDDAAIEMTLVGCDIAFEGERDEECRVVLAGSGARRATLRLAHASDGLHRPIIPWEPFLVRPGDFLRCGAMTVGDGGVRAYLCVQSGIDVQRVLGSRSMHVRAGLGGHDREVLRTGDVLRVRPRLRQNVEARRMPSAVRPLVGETATEGRAASPRAISLWITPGPHAELFVRSPGALLDHAEFTVASRSDRMGLRLEGVALPTPASVAAGGGRLASEPMPGGGGGGGGGAIQVPPDGHPIVLMPDGPTTGGYPVIATVASVHVPKLGRLGPGARVRFTCVEEARAREEWRRVERSLARELPAVPAVLLNADIGEDATQEGIARDLALIEQLDLIHVACGGHAGDEGTMRSVVRAATRASRSPNPRGVLVGAHPSYPDRANFGRTRIALSLDALRESVRVQVQALAKIAREEGATVRTVKPHGALYHDCAEADIATAVANGARDALGDLAETCYLVGASASPAIDHWRAAGWFTLDEGFADRTYRADGTLMPRAHAGSLIADPTRAARQAEALINKRSAAIGLDTGLVLRVDTICVHSDTVGAVEIAKAVRGAVLDR